MKKFEKNKRGMGIGDIYPVMLAIALVAVLIAIVLMVLSSMQTSGVSERAAFTNESLTLSGDSISTAISGITACGYSSWNATAILNGTAGGFYTNETLVEGTDYSINVNGSIMNITDTAGDGVRVTGFYSWKGAACDSTSTIISQIANFVPWIGIILLVVAAAIVIGILVRNLAGGQRV